MLFGKSVLSQNLRTNCELALYLTLNTPAERRRKALPEAIKSRPSVQSLQQAGIDFENGINQLLARHLGDRCIHHPRDPKTGDWPSLPMRTALNQLATDRLPTLILQPKMELGNISADVYRHLGVAGDRLPSMPDIEGLIPDILMAIPARPGEYEVLPNADRKVVPPGDARTALVVIDVKHARDPNPSYSAEVVLYAVMLANWLQEEGLRDRFLVKAETFLWTRGSTARGNLKKTLDGDQITPDTILAAIKDDLEPINTAIYLQTVRRFLAEHVPDVIERGIDDWRTLDWAVGPSCGSCDWLAFPDYLSSDQEAVVNANPGGYCLRRARETDHLSRMPSFTKGARRVMRTAGIDTVAKVASTTGVEAVYERHNRLQAERLALPAYARAIGLGTTDIDADRKDGLLAGYADLNIFVSVNFDVGSGLLTGIAAHVRFNQPTPFVENRPDDEERSRVGNIFRTDEWVTTAKSAEAEESMLVGFLQFMADAIDHAHDPAPLRGGPLAQTTSTQVVFWTDREFEELCLAMGRHIQLILFDRQSPRILRAMAWLFPPEDLQERDEPKPNSPMIAFAQRTLNRLVRTPSEHAQTLFRVAEHYRHVSERAPAWRSPDTFYSEPFADGVPRERIYEIWQITEGGGGGVARWGSVRKSLSDLVAGYRRALGKQVTTLADVTVRLRRDFKPRLRAKAGRLNLTIPRWAHVGSPDAKLIAAWAAFDNAYGTAQAFRRFFMDPAEIEASHAGVRLIRHRGQHPDGTLEYDISPASANTKIRAPDAYLCIAFNDEPGFLNMRVKEILGRGVAPHDQGNLSMYQVFRVELVELNRSARTARIRLDNDPERRQLRQSLLTKLNLSPRSDMTLLDGLGTSIQVERLRMILQEIGNPAIATAAPETGRALGAQAAFKRGHGPVTPPARVLWEADVLARSTVRPDDAVREIAEAGRHLNPSQRAAVEHAARMGLTVLWGPPGTGKTQTATAFVHGTIRHEARHPRREAHATLITGPNYKAVAELAGRVLRALDADPDAPCSVYFIRPARRATDLSLPEELSPHLSGQALEAEDGDPGVARLAADLRRPGSVLVVTVAHQCPKLAEVLGNAWGERQALVRPVFDLVLVDESSQVDMTIGAGPIALLKDASQLVIAGDHLQMPPVFQAEPPVGAEYLVGSLQTYLTKRFRLRTVDLAENYRSHRDIVAYIKRLGYSEDLQASNPETSLRWLRPIPDAIAETGGASSDAWSDLLDPTRPIVALTYPDGMSGQANPFEAECIATMVQALFLGTSCSLDGRTPQDAHAPWTAEAFWERGVGVVTPHRAQRAQVLAALERTFPHVDPTLIDGAVDTVERFQGGERHTILISFGLGDPDLIGGEERFLLKLERTNVAISRAMAKCIVVMSEEMVGHLPADRKAAEGAHALRGIVDEWCNRSRSTTVGLADGTVRRVRPRWRG